MSADKAPRVLALSGGIGGAKLALGLDHMLPAGDLAVLCNTGDDFEHLGLHISPDIDTVMYTLAGIANPETGWGRAQETWTFMDTLESIGGESWFRLGDRDLAVHVERTRRLNEGESLSSITADIAKHLGVQTTLLPMSDRPVRTLVDTDEGILPFQRYFVERRCAPRVKGFTFDGAERAKPPPMLEHILDSDRLEAVVICPSNPFISVDPILAVPGMREVLRASRAPVVAVSPIIGGRAVKGPTAKMMTELGLPSSSASIAEHYRGLLDGLALDEADAGDVAVVDLPCLTTKTLMITDKDKRRLATAVLEFAGDLAKDKSGRS
ncbi:MAG: 2-phospho-L-lactate transferase [Pseudomonadota bacterium]